MAIPEYLLRSPQKKSLFSDLAKPKEVFSLPKQKVGQPMQQDPIISSPTRTTTPNIAPVKPTAIAPQSTTPQPVATQQPPLYKKIQGVVRSTFPNIMAPLDGGFSKESFQEIDSPVAKQFRAVSAGLVGGVAETAETISRLIVKNKDKLSKIPNPATKILKLIPDDQIPAVQKKTSEFFTQAADKLYGYQSKAVKDLPEDWQQGQWKDLAKSGQILPYLFSSLTPYIAMTTISGGIGGTGLALGVGGAASGGQAKREARAFGASEDVQDKVALGVGALSAVTEFGPLKIIFGKNNPLKQAFLKSVLRPLSVQAIKAGTAEGGQEIVQNVGTDLIAKWYYDNERDILNELKKNGLAEGAIGFLLGAGSRGAVNLGRNVQNREAPIGLSIRDVSQETPTPENQENDFVPKMDKIESDVSLLDPEGQVESEVLGEMEIAKPGQRDVVGSGKDIRVAAQQSTFPQWVSSELRSSKLFDDVLNKIKKSEIPQNIGAVRLYTEFLNQINTRLGIQEQYTPEDIIQVRDNKKAYQAQNQKITSRLLKMAQSISRPARPAEIKRAISSQTKTPPSKTIQIKETTLLKNRLKNIAAGARLASAETRKEVKNVQSQIVGAVRSSELSSNDRDKFLRLVKNVQTPEQLKTIMPKIEKRIQRLEVRAERRGVLKNISTLLKKTKPTESGKYPKGKYTPQIQSVLDVARDAAKMTKKEAEARIASNLQKYKGYIPTQIALENRILARRSGSLQDLNDLYKELDETVRTGQLSRDLQNFNKETDIEQSKGVVLDVLPKIDSVSQIGGETKKEKIQRFVAGLGKRYLLSFRGKMTAMGSYADVGDKRLEKEFDILDQENKYKELTTDFINKFTKLVADVYNITGKNRASLGLAINSKMNDLRKEIDYGILEFADGKKRRLVLNKDQAIKRYMEFQDPTLEESFANGNLYTKEIKDQIEKSLTPEDKEFAKKQLEMYREQYDRVNDVYSRMNGVNLPFNEFYSPIRRVGFKSDALAQFGEFLDEFSTMPGVNSKSLNARVDNNLEIEAQNSTNVLLRHFMETNYYVAWAERIQLFNAVFTDPQVRATVQKYFGKNFQKFIERDIQQLASNGRAFGESEKIIDAFRKSYAVGALMIKPIQVVKQFTSVFAYLDELSAKDFMLGMADFFKNPIQNARTLNKESTFLRERINYKERDLTDALNSDVYKIWNSRSSLLNTLMLNVSIGDKGAVLIGSWAMRRKALREGKDLKEAINEYSNFGQETQQSSDPSRLAAIQTGDPYSKLFTMFQSYSRAALQKELTAVRSLMRKGGTSPKNIFKVARTIFIFRVLLPLLSQMIASGIWGDDEERNKEYLRAVLLGNLNGLFIVGGAIDAILRQALNLKVWDQEIPILGLVDSIRKAMESIDMDDISASDFEEAVEGLAGVGQSAGLPSEYVLTAGKSVKKLLEGDTEKAILSLIGFSDYALNVEEKNTYVDDKEALVKKYKGAIQKGTMSKEAGVKALVTDLKELNKSTVTDLKKNIKDMSEEDATNTIRELVQQKVLSPKEGTTLLAKHLQYSREREANIKEEEERVARAKDRGVLSKPDPDIIENEPVRDIVTRAVKALGVDWRVALRAILSSEDIDFVNEERVGLERLAQEQTEEFKKSYGAKGDDYKLEHIIPRAIGGRSDIDSGNYRVVSTAQWKQFTKADNLVIQAVENDRISPARARKLIKQYKDGDISFAELEQEVNL